MALINYNGRFCEQDFENALVQMFVDNGWEYLFGDNIERSSGTEVLIADTVVVGNVPQTLFDMQ